MTNYTGRKMMQEIIESFIGESAYEVQENFSGHINHTYFIKSEKGHYVLQKINTNVFTAPEIIIDNMLAVAKHLEENNYSKPIIRPIKNQAGQYLTKHKGTCWRMIPFFEESQNFLKALNVQQVEAAAHCLGEFHAHTFSLDATAFEEPIADFINFQKRLNAFSHALNHCHIDRVDKAKNEIEFLQKHRHMVEDWIAIVDNDLLPMRMIHGDPKISNYLFTKDDAIEPLALIDWDTLMPGTILYDFGDMVRSFTNNKEEDDPAGGEVFSISYFKALKRGFVSNLKDKLEPIEIQNLDNAGKVVIYVQAMRFLTDYLNGDIYFKTNRENQNLDRARNQINLLTELLAYLKSTDS